MPSDTIPIAVITDVFPEPADQDRLVDRLQAARAAGAELAILPELPLNPWSAATKNALASDEEPPDGPRARRQAEAAATAGIALVGGAIVRDPADDRRYNTALVYDATGALRSTFRKVHVPDEPGFWERDHYDAGAEAAAPIGGLPVTLGVQICSDINRPEGCHILGAMGAQLVAAPRCTEAATWERWRTVFRANAMTSGLYIASANRPGPEAGVLIGGPSTIVAPSGEVLVETTDPVAVAEISRAKLAEAKRAYPGYLTINASMYADAWARAATPAGAAR